MSGDCCGAPGFCTDMFGAELRERAAVIGSLFAEVGA